MNELIFVHNSPLSVSTIINGGPVLGVDFMEGGKSENPEKNLQSTGESNYDNSIHIPSLRVNMGLYPNGYPSS